MKEGWACLFCTFANEKGVKKCGCCGNNFTKYPPWSCSWCKDKGQATLNFGDPFVMSCSGCGSQRATSTTDRLVMHGKSTHAGNVAADAGEKEYTELINSGNVTPGRSSKKVVSLFVVSWSGWCWCYVLFCV